MRTSVVRQTRDAGSCVQDLQTARRRFSSRRVSAIALFSSVGLPPEDVVVVLRGRDIALRMSVFRCRRGIAMSARWRGWEDRFTTRISQRKGVPIVIG